MGDPEMADESLIPDTHWLDDPAMSHVVHSELPLLLPNPCDMEL